MDKEKVINDYKAKVLQLRHNLNITDYLAIKFAEGELTTSEYAETKQKRKEWRTEINELEAKIKQEEQ